MKLRSDMPFRLIKSTVLDEGPYAQHVALIIRQEMPFRFLALPLHIRTKILNFTLKHHEPAISVVIKVPSPLFPNHLPSSLTPPRAAPARPGPPPTTLRTCSPSYAPASKSTPKPRPSSTPNPSPSPAPKSSPTSSCASAATGA